MEEGQTQEERMITVAITFQGESEGQSLKLREKEDIYTLMDYDEICKKILNAYRYKLSGKPHILLSVQNFYRTGRLTIPIRTPQNYAFLIGDMINRGLTTVAISITRTGQLQKKKKREKAVPIQFDSDGSIEQAQGVGASTFVNANRPKAPPYLSSAAVRCMFCKKSSREGDEKRIAGAFYGPFFSKSYAHLMCLLWCSYVYLDENQQLVGVDKAFKVSQRLRCSYCKQMGASFYCHANKCRKAGHYSCGLNNDWSFDWVKYQTYCPDCKPREEVGIEESRSRTITQKRSQVEPEQICKEEQHQNS